MAQPYLSEIQIFGFNFNPRGWALCDGQILPINQNQSLFSLLGTMYGGDGRTSFGLPELRGRTPIHFSGGTLGGRGGAETVALTAAQMPSHSHTFQGNSGQADQRKGTGLLLADAHPDNVAQDQPSYTSAANLRSLSSSAVTNTGGGQGHNNLQPSLVLNFCIALQGTFPSRN